MSNNKMKLVVKKSFFKKIISCLLSISLLVNSLLPYSIAGVAYAQELTSPTPSPTSSPEATTSTSIEPTFTATPSATPEPTLEPSPEVTPSATLEPTVEATPTTTPTVEPIASTEPTSISEEKIPLRKAGNSLKESKKQVNKNYVEGEVIVKFKTSKLNVKSALGKAQAFVFEKKFSLSKTDEIKTSNIQVFKSNKSTEEIVKELKTDLNVEYAEPNYLRYPTTITTNDTHKDKLWGLDNTGQTVEGSYSVHTGISDKDIDAPEAWGIPGGISEGNGTIVAVIDSGVAYNHPDLVNSMWDGSGCKDENGNALGGCNSGYDYEDGDKSPLPSTSSHGTHIAGTIAAAKNNAKGIIGVAPQTKIMALKFGLNVTDEVNSIDFAIQNGAKIINASFGGESYSQSEYDAINRFKTAGGIFVAAAGNNSSNNESTPNYPSGYNLDNIISVAATDQNDSLASFSNYGATSVDIGAPGTNIYSTIADIQTTEVLNETFESVNTPDIPSGWEKTANWGTYDLGGAWGKVLYGDVYNVPYAQTANSTTTSSLFSLNGASKTEMDFWTACDTEYSATNWTDYMTLEVSGDGGSSYAEVLRWDEYYIDSDIDPSDSAVYHFENVAIPNQYVTGNFKFRFRWVANGNTDTGGGDGCKVDDIQINKFTLGSSEIYGYDSGTSMAVPHVAGLVALIEGYNPNLTVAQVKDKILTTGDSVSALSGKTVFGKRINAKNALDASAPAPSTIATVTSGTYTVGATTITNVPFGTSKFTFEAALTKGESHQTWTDSGVHDPVVTSDVLVVTAQDGSTQVIYVITVNPDYATIFGGIKTTLLSQGITTNIDICASTPTGCIGLYFEKTGYGRVTFNSSLNLTDTDTNTFLQTLGTKMDANAGSMSFDASTAEQLRTAGAVIKIYGFSHGAGTDPITEDELVVKNDSGVVIDPSDGNYPSITGFTWDNVNGAVTFGTDHFTQFYLNDTIKPYIVSFSVPLTATSLEVGGITVTAHDNRGISGLMFSESNLPPSKTDLMWSSGTPSTYNFASAGTKTLYAWAKDDAGNVSNVYEGKTVTITLPPPPNISPSFDSIAGQSINEDSSSQEIFITGVSAGSGEDDQTVTISATSSDPSIVPNPIVTGSGATRTLTYTSVADAYGTVTISVLANDGQTSNNTYSQSFNITVNPVNDAPSFTKGSDQTISEDAGAQTVSGWATSISRGPANESGQTLSFNVTNNNNSLFSVQPTVAAMANGKLTYTPAANANGSATVTVSLSDNDGATSVTQTFTITVNAVNDMPTVTVTLPNGGEIWAGGSSHDITWIASDVDTGQALLVNLDYTIDGGAVYTNIVENFSNLGTYSWTVPTTINSSTVKIRALAIDNIVNAAPSADSTTGSDLSNANFTIDSTSPSVTYNYPTAGGQTIWYNSDPGNVIDVDFIWGGGAPLDNAQRKIGTESFTNIFTADQSSNYTTNWGFPTWSSLSEGLNEISVKVADTVGNVRTDDYVAGVSGFLFRKDTGVPTTTDSGIDTNWHSSDVTVTLNCLDTVSGCATTYHTSDGTTPTISSSTINPFTLATDGNYTIKYFSKDAAGNIETVKTAEATVKIDKTVPAVVLTDDHVDSIVKDADTVIITATFTEADQIDELTPPTLSINSNPIIVTNAPMTKVSNLVWNYSWNIPSGNNGTHTVSITATDRAGNSNTTATGKTSYTIDNSAPTVASVNSDGQTYNITTVSPHTIKVTFSEDIANIPTIDVNPPTQNQTVNACNDIDAKTFCFDYSIVTVQDVTHTIYITNAQDIAGNTMAQDSGHTFQVDTVAPALSSVNIASNNADTTKAKVGDTVTLHFFSSEPIKPPTVYIAGHHISEDDISNNVSGGNGNEWFAHYQMAGGDSEGQVTLSISYIDAVDNAGSTVTGTTDNSTVTFDKTKPIIAFHDNIAATATSEDSSVVTYTSPSATDNVDTTADATCTPASGSTFPIGETTVNCTKTDTAGNTATPTSFTVTVTANNPPSFNAIANQTVNEDSSSQNVSITNVLQGSGESGQTVNVTATSSDPTIVPNPMVTGSGSTRTLTYAPAADKYGSTIVTVVADDGQFQNNTSFRTFTITVNSVNDAPSFTKGSDQSISEDAGAQTVSNWATNISTGSTNESDQTVNFIITNNNNSLFSVQPAVSANGTLTYTTVANTNGSTTVTVSLHDDGGTTNGGHDTSPTQTFMITVNPVNDAPVANDDSVLTNEDTAITITLSGSDIDGDTLTYSIINSSTNGTLSGVSNNQVTYTPNVNYAGNDSFTFKVDDNTNSFSSFSFDLFKKLVSNSFLMDYNSSDTATISITITPVNDAPVANPDSASVNEDETLTISKSALLTNDTDVDGDTLTITGVSNSINGSVVINGTNVKFTPTNNYFGSASFNYTVSDGSLLTNTGTVNITINSINDVPVADTQTVIIEEDTSVTINLVGTDIDEDLLTYSIVSDVGHGTLGEILGNQFSYTPNPDYTGSDSFEFKVNDEIADSNSALVSIIVTPFNDPPVLNSIGNRSVNELEELTFTVTANDPEGSLLTYSLSGNPAGSSIHSSSGVFSWIPTETQGPENYTLSVVVSDGTKTNSEEITVNVNEVNVAPVANNVSVSTNEDIDKIITLNATDSDLPVQTLIYSKVSGPSHGSISITGNEATYTPLTNYNGVDSFTYRANDETVNSNTATISITVNPVNDDPVLDSIGNKTVDEMATLSFTATALDPDNSPTYSLTNAPTGATIDNATGVFSFTPTEAQGPGIYTITVNVTDGTSTDLETITITVNEVNVVPVSNNVFVSTNEDTTKTITLDSSDSDLPVQSLVYSKVTDPSHGTLGAISGDQIMYVPSSNYNGTDSFTFKSSDGTLDSNIATVTITVNSINDAPVAVNGSISTGEEVTKTITLNATDSDIPVQSLVYSKVTDPSHGTLGTVSGNQITYTPNTNYSGTDSFTFKANDGIDNSNTATIIITVIANPNAPFITSVATDNVINNSEKTAIHVIGTAEANSLVTITLTGGANTKSGTQQLTGGATEYDIVVDGTMAIPGSLSDGTITVSATATNSIGGVSDAATTTIIKDTVFPTVTKLGDNSEDVVLIAGDTDLIFNEVLSNSSKTIVTNALTAGADKTLMYSWTGTALTITITETTTFGNDVVVNVSDIAGNISNSLLIVDSNLSNTQATPDIDGDVTLSGEITEVVLTDPNQAVDITITDGTDNPTIDVSAFITDGEGDIPQITITSDTADIAIPATTVTGPIGWDGVIVAPTITTIDLPVVSGETSTLGTAIEIGFATDKLSFNNAVRILLPNQTGKRAGYSREGTAFTEITNICSSDSQTVGDALEVDGECKIDVGLDLVIWTKHFTKFASYTQTANSSSGGVGTTTAGAPVCNDTKPGSAPSGLTAVAGLNSVTLTWNKASDPVSYYLITYGTSSGSQTYGNPNIGGSSTTSYTITNLSGGVRYYFKVRAGNGCAPGDYSNEASITPSGGFVEGIAPGFEAGVLGESTEQNLEITPSPTPGPSPSPEVRGANTTDFNWWIVIIPSLLGLIIFVLLLRKNKSSYK